MSIHPLQKRLEHLISTWGTIPPSAQTGITRLAAAFAPSFCKFGRTQISFEKHPLQTLYHLLQRNDVPTSTLRNHLNELPEDLRGEIYYEVWTQADEPNGAQWGEEHALDNPIRLLSIIKSLVERKLDLLPSEKRNTIFGTIYRMANAPQVEDHQWGEHHAKVNTERLIRALHRHQCLGIPGETLDYLLNVEDTATVRSHNFHLYRPELPQGMICKMNGMFCVYSRAQEHAYKLSDLAQGYNVHCTYSATANEQWDITVGFLGQGGTITPAVLCLLDQWLDFFETHETDRLLQICSSRGCIEVATALRILPDHLCQRIIVVAVAPAYLLPQKMAYKVVNLVIESDPVLSIAGNRHLMNEPHITKLPPHEDTDNPHDMFGSSYVQQLSHILNSYIGTNDIA